MEKQIYFEKHIKFLLIDNDNFIYKNNLVLLEKYYNYIWDNLKNPDIAKKYLKLFTIIDDIKNGNIETFFYEILSESLDLTSILSSDLINSLNELENINGVYILYNNIDNIIYIGKSKNLSNRIKQSIINKLPFNVSSIKYIKTNKNISQASFIEALLIDFYKPMLNQQLEPLPQKMTYRDYSRSLLVINKFISKKIQAI